MPNATDDLHLAFDRLLTAHSRDPLPTYETRRGHLVRLRQAILDHKRELIQATNEDFGNRAELETVAAEIWVVLATVDYTLSRLKAWMKPHSRHTALVYAPGWSEVRPQPLGVVGIISPWNYPIQLALVPLVSALAAGNRVMLKPSEYTPRVAEVLTKLLGALFPEDLVRVVTGDAELGAAFSQLPFNHLFFTGSTAVGRLVMKAAAANLTPVTLELGGKSPVLVHPDYPIDSAVERIVWGKLLNAGQTCIAPDYALIHTNRLDAFVQAVRARVAAYYPSFRDNKDYTSIISDRHLARLQGYLDDARSKGATVLSLAPDGEDLDGSGKLAPHLVLNPTDDMRVMQEEIFGPILPIETFDALDDALTRINSRPHPLALYYFDRDADRIDHVLDHTISGGVAINEVLLHVAQDDLPFGGVGASGMGAYHGHEGFQTFSHMKSVYHQRRLNVWRKLVPPYTNAVNKLIDLWVR